MNRKDIFNIIEKFLSEHNKPHYKIIAFHLFSGRIIVLPINTTIFSKGKRILLVIEEFKEHTLRLPIFTEWFIPYNEIMIVVLK